MAFVAYAKETSMDGKEIYNVFSCVETFIFRRLMCDLPTSALNKIFATLHNSVIKNKRETDSYSSVMIYLLESRRLSSAFPKDEEFISGFTTKNIYSMRGKNKEYIFERLENGSSKEKNDVVGNIEKGILTIEHIMPQTLTTAWKQALGEDWEAIQERWLHTISNLTLTGYNSNYSNRTFQEKKTMKNGFVDSGIRLNHFVAQFDKWDEEELNKRKAKLSEMALEIWTYPITAFVPEQKEDDIVFLSEDNGVATYRDIQYFIFREERQEVASWAEMMWEVVNKLYVMNPAILYQEAAGNNVWFATSAVSKNYRKLAEGLYYCPTSSSTWNKMAILKNLFRLYGIDEDDLSFGLQPKKEEVVRDISHIERVVRKEPRIWLLPANGNYFDHDGCFKKYGCIYWRQNYNFLKGDTVYVYSTAPISSIRYKVIVEQSDLAFSDEMEKEREFYFNSADFDRMKQHNRMALFSLVEETESDKLGYEDLLQHGMNGPVQGVLNLSLSAYAELLKYIEENF